MRKYNLELTVFFSGAVVMVLEIVGSRILSPYVGGSTFVWTSLIGIILGSLSIGYYIGGKIADKKHSPGTLSLLILISAALIGLTTLLKDPILTAIQQSDLGIRSASVLGAIILFAPASMFLGTISPYAIRLKMTDVKTSGSTVGNLYAISTIGSIVGTFLAGFYLISVFGNTKLLLILSATLVIASIFPTLKKTSKSHIAAIIALLIGFFFVNNQISVAKAGFIELDTQYNNIQIFDTKDIYTNKPIKMLKMNNTANSAMYLKSDELVFPYTKFYRLADHFNPHIESGLVIGGAAYSYPKDFLTKHPDANLDVVEIDPKLTELAKEHFRLKDDPRLTSYHEDGRTYLNTTEKRYDAIYMDAFGSSYSIPYQLTTIETIEKMYEILNDDGVVITNIISAIDGDKGKFFRAEYKTYLEVFPQVYVFPVRDKNNTESAQNIILVAIKSDDPATFTSENPELNSYLKHLSTNEIATDMPILTDDFAPVDQYIMALQ